MSGINAECTAVTEVLEIWRFGDLNRQIANLQIPKCNYQRYHRVMSDSRSAVVPGAGRAERFGSQKLLADLDGEPLLNHTLRSLLDAGLQRVVLVVSRELSLASVS